MKNYIVSLCIILAAMFAASCSNTKNVAYFQNLEDVDLAASKGLFEAHIMPMDELTITVHASNPTAASIFNLAIQSTTSNVSSGNLSSQQRLMPYIVDNEGYINYPQLGRIHVVGMSRTQLQDYLTEKIKPYFAENENPIVTVVMSNYRVTVMGEVGGSRVVNVTSEKMSILEAIASAGDLGIYGKRQNVLLIREDATGQKTAHRLNLNDANIITSPYYYVQQNDVIYVEPNTVKAKNSDIGSSTTLWMSFVSIAITLTNFVINVLK